MTLTLYILRHAHAVHDHSYADFDRPLTHGGTREAAEIGKLLAVRGDRPARILCSSAQRTRETLAGVLGDLAHECAVDLTQRLYDADAAKLLGIVHEQADAPSLMLIGHNPGLAELALELSGCGDEGALQRLHEGFPPAALAVIEFDAAAHWSDISPTSGRLLALERTS